MPIQPPPLEGVQRNLTFSEVEDAYRRALTTPKGQFYFPEAEFPRRYVQYTDGTISRDEIYPTSMGYTDEGLRKFAQLGNQLTGTEAFRAADLDKWGMAWARSGQGVNEIAEDYGVKWAGGKVGQGIGDLLFDDPEFGHEIGEHMGSALVAFAPALIGGILGKRVPGAQYAGNMITGAAMSGLKMEQTGDPLRSTVAGGLAAVTPWGIQKGAHALTQGAAKVVGPKISTAVGTLLNSSAALGMPARTVPSAVSSFGVTAGADIVDIGLADDRTLGELSHPDYWKAHTIGSVAFLPFDVMAGVALHKNAVAQQSLVNVNAGNRDAISQSRLNSFDDRVLQPRSIEDVVSATGLGRDQTHTFMTVEERQAARKTDPMFKYTELGQKLTPERFDVLYGKEKAKMGKFLSKFEQENVKAGEEAKLAWKRSAGLIEKYPWDDPAAPKDSESKPVTEQRTKLPETSEEFATQLKGMNRAREEAGLLPIDDIPLRTAVERDIRKGRDLATAEKRALRKFSDQSERDIRRVEAGRIQIERDRVFMDELGELRKSTPEHTKQADAFEDAVTKYAADSTLRQDVERIKRDWETRPSEEQGIAPLRAKLDNIVARAKKRAEANLPSDPSKAGRKSDVEAGNINMQDLTAKVEALGSKKNSEVWAMYEKFTSELDRFMVSGGESVAFFSVLNKWFKDGNGGKMDVLGGLLKAKKEGMKLDTWKKVKESGHDDETLQGLMDGEGHKQWMDDQNEGFDAMLLKRAVESDQDFIMGMTGRIKYTEDNQLVIGTPKNRIKISGLIDEERLVKLLQKAQISPPEWQAIKRSQAITDEQFLASPAVMKQLLKGDFTGAAARFKDNLVVYPEKGKPIVNAKNIVNTLNRTFITIKDLGFQRGPSKDPAVLQKEGEVIALHQQQADIVHQFESLAQDFDANFIRDVSGTAFTGKELLKFYGELNTRSFPHDVAREPKEYLHLDVLEMARLAKEETYKIQRGQDIPHDGPRRDQEALLDQGAKMFDEFRQSWKASHELSAEMSRFGMDAPEPSHNPLVSVQTPSGTIYSGEVPPNWHVPFTNIGPYDTQTVPFVMNKTNPTGDTGFVVVMKGGGQGQNHQDAEAHGLPADNIVFGRGRFTEHNGELIYHLYEMQSDGLQAMSKDIENFVNSLVDTNTGKPADIHVNRRALLYTGAEDLPTHIRAQAKASAVYQQQDSIIVGVTHEFRAARGPRTRTNYDQFDELRAYRKEEYGKLGEAIAPEWDPRLVPLATAEEFYIVNPKTKAVQLLEHFTKLPYKTGSVKKRVSTNNETRTHLFFNDSKTMLDDLLALDNLTPRWEENVQNHPLLKNIQELRDHGKYFKENPDLKKRLLQQAEKGWPEDVTDVLPTEHSWADEAIIPGSSAINKGIKKYLTDKAHPMLDEWKNIGLRATVSHAIKGGATKLVLADGTTVNYGEGHNASLRLAGRPKIEELFTSVQKDLAFEKGELAIAPWLGRTGPTQVPQLRNASFSEKQINDFFTHMWGADWRDGNYITPTKDPVSNNSITAKAVEEGTADASIKLGQNPHSNINQSNLFSIGISNKINLLNTFRVDKPKSNGSLRDMDLALLASFRDAVYASKDMLVGVDSHSTLTDSTRFVISNRLGEVGTLDEMLWHLGYKMDDRIKNDSLAGPGKYEAGDRKTRVERALELGKEVPPSREPNKEVLALPISRAKGMEVNYDEIYPNTLAKLTGEKGEPVNLGKGWRDPAKSGFVTSIPKGAEIFIPWNQRDVHFPEMGVVAADAPAIAARYRNEHYHPEDNPVIFEVPIKGWSEKPINVSPKVNDAGETFYFRLMDLHRLHSQASYSDKFSESQFTNFRNQEIDTTIRRPANDPTTNAPNAKRSVPTPAAHFRASKAREGSVDLIINTPKDLTRYAEAARDYIINWLHLTPKSSIYHQEQLNSIIEAFGFRQDDNVIPKAFRQGSLSEVPITKQGVQHTGNKGLSFDLGKAQESYQKLGGVPMLGKTIGYEPLGLNQAKAAENMLLRNGFTPDEAAAHAPFIEKTGRAFEELSGQKIEIGTIVDESGRVAGLSSRSPVQREILVNPKLAGNAPLYSMLHEAFGHQMVKSFELGQLDLQTTRVVENYLKTMVDASPAELSKLWDSWAKSSLDKETYGTTREAVMEAMNQPAEAASNFAALAAWDSITKADPYQHIKFLPYPIARFVVETMRYMGQVFTAMKDWFNYRLLSNDVSFENWKSIRNFESKISETFNKVANQEHRDRVAFERLGMVMPGETGRYRSDAIIDAEGLMFKGNKSLNMMADAMLLPGSKKGKELLKKAADIWEPILHRAERYPALVPYANWLRGESNVGHMLHRTLLAPIFSKRGEDGSLLMDDLQRPIIERRGTADKVLGDKKLITAFSDILRAQNTERKSIAGIKEDNPKLYNDLMEGRSAKEINMLEEMSARFKEATVRAQTEIIEKLHGKGQKLFARFLRKDVEGSNQDVLRTAEELYNQYRVSRDTEQWEPYMIRAAELGLDAGVMRRFLEPYINDLAKQKDFFRGNQHYVSEKRWKRYHVAYDDPNQKATGRASYDSPSEALAAGAALRKKGFKLLYPRVFKDMWTGKNRPELEALDETLDFAYMKTFTREMTRMKEEGLIDAEVAADLDAAAQNYRASIESAGMTQDVTKLGSARRFAPGREELDMALQHMVWLSKVSHRVPQLETDAMMRFGAVDPAVIGDANHFSMFEQLGQAITNFRRTDTELGQQLLKGAFAHYMIFRTSTAMIEAASWPLWLSPHLTEEGAGMVSSYTLPTEASAHVAGFNLTGKWNSGITVDIGGKQVDAYAALIERAAAFRRLGRGRSAEFFEAAWKSQEDLGRIAKGMEPMGEKLITRPAGWMFNTGAKLYSWFVSVNSMIGYISAFNMKRKQLFKNKKNLSEREFNTLFDEADRITEIVNNDIGRAGRPTGLFSGWRTPGMVLHSLQSFNSAQISNIWRRGVKGLTWGETAQRFTPKERAQARKAAVQGFVSLAMGAGVLGAIPFARSLVALLEKHTELEIEKELRQLIADQFEDPETSTFMADLATHGLAYAAGSEYDLSGRLALSGTAGFNDYEGWSLASLGGPIVGQFEGYVKGAGNVLKGDLSKALEDTLPKGFKDLYMAFRADGAVNSPDGKVKYLPTDSERIGIAMGFQPSALSQMREEQRIGSKSERVIRDRNRRFYKQVAKAAKNQGPLVAQQMIREKAQTTPGFSEQGAYDGVIAYLEREEFGQDTRRQGSVQGALEARRIAQTFRDRGTPRYSKLQEAEHELGARASLGDSRVLNFRPEQFSHAVLVDLIQNQTGLNFDAAGFLARQLSSPSPEAVPTVQAFLEEPF